MGCKSTDSDWCILKRRRFTHIAVYCKISYQHSDKRHFLNLLFFKQLVSNGNKTFFKKKKYISVYLLVFFFCISLKHWITKKTTTLSLVTCHNSCSPLNHARYISEWYFLTKAQKSSTALWTQGPKIDIKEILIPIYLLPLGRFFRRVALSPAQPNS